MFTYSIIHTHQKKKKTLQFQQKLAQIRHTHTIQRVKARGGVIHAKISNTVSAHDELIISGLNILSDNTCQTLIHHALTAVTGELISMRRASLLSHALQVRTRERARHRCEWGEVWEKCELSARVFHGLPCTADVLWRAVIDTREVWWCERCGGCRVGGGAVFTPL